MAKEELFKTAVRKAQEGLLKTSGDSLDHFRLIDDARKVIKRDNQPCYASFARLGNDGDYDEPEDEPEEHRPGFKPKLFMVWHTLAPDEPVFRQYIRWVLRRSPYAQAFITKTAKEVFTFPTLLSTEFHARYIIGAAMCIRYRREFPRIIRTWKKLSKHMSEDLAFIFAHYLSDYGDKYLSSLRAHGGHNLYDGMASKTGIYHWLKHEPAFNLKDNTVRKGFYNYYSLWDVWGTGKGQIVFPPPNDFILKKGWDMKEVKSPVYSWAKMADLVQQFLELNNLKEAYAYNTDRFSRRR